MLNRGAPNGQPLYLVNVPTKDNHEEALIAATQVLQMCKSVRNTPHDIVVARSTWWLECLYLTTTHIRLLLQLMDYDDWEVHFDENLEEFQRRYKRPATYTVLFW